MDLLAWFNRTQTLAKGGSASKGPGLRSGQFGGGEPQQLAEELGIKYPQKLRIFICRLLRVIPFKGHFDSSFGTSFRDKPNFALSTEFDPEFRLNL